MEALNKTQQAPPLASTGKKSEAAPLKFDADQ